jgi:hypothetical protein
MCCIDEVIIIHSRKAYCLNYPTFQTCCLHCP